MGNLGCIGGVVPSPLKDAGIVAGSVCRLATADVGLDALDATGTDGGKLLVLRVTECARCAVLPVLGQLPISNGLAHPVLDPLGVLPGALLGMVANKDRLSKGNTIRDGLNGVVRLGGVLGSLRAEVF